jgi:hypothetical protein
MPVLVDHHEHAHKPCMKNEKKAVKNGVDDPTAWLNDTGKYLRDAFPSTMVMQNIAARRAIFSSCSRDFMGFAGYILVVCSMMLTTAQAIMWHSDRKTGNLHNQRE